jgi:hypothetical protein
MAEYGEAIKMLEAQATALEDAAIRTAKEYECQRSPCCLLCAVGAVEAHGRQGAAAEGVGTRAEAVT